MEKYMKIDAYTKFVLTIIAVCLVWICLKDFAVFPALYAAEEQDVVNVKIVGFQRTSWESWDPVMLDISDNLPVDVKGSVILPVKIENEILPVDVKHVAVKKVTSLNEDKE
jgi:hypothetical protein